MSSVRAGARAFARKFTSKGKLGRAVAPYLSDATCIDVGASYYPHAKWYLFLESAATRWIVVEPNAANIGYAHQWRWPSEVAICTTGLSKQGGAHTLYITNVDSGSSLLEPKIPASMAGRILNLDYFFPLRQQQIETLTLAEVAARGKPQAPIFVKLDTQGTELSILSGAEQQLRSHSIVGIEMEATLLAQPLMPGAGKFWEAQRYLEEAGFELLLVHPIYGPSRLGRRRTRGYTFINECDAVFAVRPDLAEALPVGHRVGLFAFYLCNRLFEEALAFLNRDAEVARALTDRGCDTRALAATIRAIA